uniref:Uncharacterized protein n=1 Tax=Anguilla anguilla TaxID=7936 RepID=A0A0E9UAD1_ANGAN
MQVMGSRSGPLRTAGARTMERMAITTSTEGPGCVG